MPLDKAARLEADRKAKEAAAKPPALNPPFPYRAKPFDPKFFRVTLTASTARAGAPLR